MADPADGLIVMRTAAHEERGGRVVVIGLVVEGGVVTEVAPYGRQFNVVGLDAREVWRGLVKRGWRLYWLPDRSDPPGGPGQDEAQAPTDRESHDERQQVDHSGSTSR